MSPEQRARVIEVMRDIQADVEADTKRRNGEPFDGRHVGQALGEISAMVHAVAQAVELIAAALPEQEGE